MTTLTSNVDIVRSLYDAFARHDVDAVINAMQPDIELTTPASLPWSKGEYHGHDGALAFFGSAAGTLIDTHVQADEFLDAGDHIIVHGRERAVVAATGESFDALFTHSYMLRDGKIARMRGVIDTAAILAAWKNTK